MEKKFTVRDILKIITFTVMLVFLFIYYKEIFAAIGKVFSILAPIIAGIIITLVLRRPYEFFCRQYGKLFKRAKSDKPAKALSAVTVYIMFFAVIGGISAFIIPSLVMSVKGIASNFDSYVEELKLLYLKYAGYLPLPDVDPDNFEAFIELLRDKIIGFVTGSIPQIFSFTSNIVGGAVTVVMGFITSIYLLVCRDKLNGMFRRIVYSYLPRRWADFIRDAYRIVDKTFTNYISGQMTEALILGVLVYIGLSVFGIDYALVSAASICVTALIPYIGAVLGCIPGGLLLLLGNPIDVVWFVLIVVIIQQIENNFIYPKVVGDFVGLDGVWVLISIIVGGGLFGLVGMMIGVPTLSCLFQLIERDIKRRGEIKAEMESV